MPLINADGSQTVGKFREAFRAETGLDARMVCGGAYAADEDLVSRCILKPEEQPRLVRARSACNRFYVISLHDTIADIESDFAKDCLLGIELHDATGERIPWNRRLIELLPADSPHRDEYREKLRELDGTLRARLMVIAGIFERRYAALAEGSAVSFAYQGYSLALVCELFLAADAAGEFNPLVRTLPLATLSGSKKQVASRREIDDELNDILNGGEAIHPRRLPYGWMLDDLMTVYGFSAHDLMRVGEFRMRIQEELWGI